MNTQGPYRPNYRQQRIELFQPQSRKVVSLCTKKAMTCTILVLTKKKLFHEWIICIFIEAKIIYKNNNY